MALTSAVVHVEASYQEEFSQLEAHKQDIPKNDGPHLMHFGTFVFCVVCCGKYGDGAGIQRPPTSARFTGMAQHITRRTGKVSLFSLMSFSICLVQLKIPSFLPVVETRRQVPAMITLQA